MSVSGIAIAAAVVALPLAAIFLHNWQNAKKENAALHEEIERLATQEARRARGAKPIPPSSRYSNGRKVVSSPSYRSGESYRSPSPSKKNDDGFWGGLFDFDSGRNSGGSHHHSDGGRSHHCDTSDHGGGSDGGGDGGGD